MAETTRTTSSGTPNQTASTQAAATSSSPGSSPGSTSSGGARPGTNPPSTNPSSTTTASPAATTAPSTTTGSSTTRSGSTTSGSTTAAANQGANQGQRAQSQPQDQATRSSAQGQQNQGQQRQQNEGQQNRGQPAQGQQQGEQGERRDDAYHVELSGDPISDAKKVGSDLVGAARDSAMLLFDAQRARIAEQITALGDALRQSTESLESTGVGSLAQYANQAAEQINGFADTVRDRSWGELAGDIESFGRRYPLTFMMSAMGVGFMLGRFLLSSSERTSSSMSGGMGSSGYRASGMRHDAGGTSRTVPSGARAEYGSSVRE